VEQELPAGLTERQITQLVDDDKIVAQELLGQSAAATCGLFLFELVDQVDEVEESAAGAAADASASDADSEVRQDQIALLCQEAAERAAGWEEQRRAFSFCRSA
jgi:hypothetical protein